MNNLEQDLLRAIQLQLDGIVREARMKMHEKIYMITKEIESHIAIKTKLDIKMSCIKTLEMNNTHRTTIEITFGE